MEINEENRVKKFSIDKSEFSIDKSPQMSPETSEPLRVSETILEEDEPIESENVKIYFFLFIF